jgi:hypothetical protein
VISGLKRTVRSALNLFGYDLVRKAYSQSLANDLAYCLSMRKIHCNDAVEIEELYRQFVFPNLPPRAGRAELLNELIGTSIGEAIYIIRYLHEAMKVPGDICEFGGRSGSDVGSVGGRNPANSRAKTMAIRQL